MVKIISYRPQKIRPFLSVRSYLFLSRGAFGTQCLLQFSPQPSISHFGFHLLKTLITILHFDRLMLFKDKGATYINDEN